MWAPTVLVDEGDSFMDGKEELRGIINAGHTRDTATVVRVEKVTRDTERNFWMSAEEAIAYGLVSRIIKNEKEV